MIALSSIDNAEASVLENARALLAVIRNHIRTEPKTAAEAVGVLARIRGSAYEDLNQLQHEYLIIRAARWLQGNGKVSPDVSWQWNPRQTGTNSEPDLTAEHSGKQILSAEITASSKPQGIIDTRMANTLEKLSVMPGSRFYFVQTEAMAKRARGKVNANHWSISVVCL